MSKLWSKIPDSWKAEAASIAKTFFAAMILFLALQVKSNDIPVGSDALISLALASIRAGVKAIIALLAAQLSQKQ